ncbi:MAG: SGNH/GDSL hydrolase family protein [Rhodovibrionaceae bacterium]
MKKVVTSLLAVLIVTMVTLFTLEGIYSLVRDDELHTSVTFQAINLGKRALGYEKELVGAYEPMFSDASDLGDLVPKIHEAGIGIGNAPFPEAKSEAAAVNIVVDGCPTLKPNLNKTAFYLRTNAFNPLDPPSIFHDQGQVFEPELAEFFERYGGRRVSMTTNADGERTTLPRVESERKVLIAGDSVAFGALIDDSETLASQLQARGRSRQYVNLGVAGSDAEEVICRLQKATEARYDGQIDELIYVYCENDLKYKRPYGKPEDAIAWIRDFAQRQGIEKVTIVFSPYVYLAAPEVTRFRGYDGGTYPHRVEGRQALKAEVEKAGFNWIDVGEIARQAIEESRSQFGFFPLYTDHNHLSPEGTRRLADRLAAL